MSLVGGSVGGSLGAVGLARESNTATVKLNNGDEEIDIFFPSR